MEMLMKVVWTSTNATKSELKVCPLVTTTHLPASHIVKMVHCSPNNVLIRRLIISNPYLKGKVHLLFGGEMSADHLLILHVHGTAADKNIPFLSSSYLTFNISPQLFGPWICLPPPQGLFLAVILYALSCYFEFNGKAEDMLLLQQEI